MQTLNFISQIHSYVGINCGSWSGFIQLERNYFCSFGGTERASILQPFSQRFPSILQSRNGELQD